VLHLIVCVDVSDEVVIESSVMITVTSGFDFIFPASLDRRLKKKCNRIGLKTRAVAAMNEKKVVKKESVAER